MSNWIEMTVIAVYLAFLIGMGMAFKKFNRDADDFFRCGARGTWWLVGMSMFMAGVSSATFTGNGSVAYSAGWSILWIYVGGLLGQLIHAIFLAGWFRQIRLTTFPEVIRDRFSISLQQFHAYTFVFFSLLTAGIQLWALAVFTSAVFGFPLEGTIIVLGAVVVFYSASGGSWAVMATDFVQSMVMLPVVVAVSVLCLIKLGGIGGLFEAIESAGLGGTFALVKAPGTVEGVHSYSWPWAVGMVVFGIMSNLGLNGAIRYFSVKDGHDAKKSAWLGLVLAGLGTLVWFIPPITARLLYSDEVAGLTQLSNPSDAAFAVAARNLLPSGLIGMIVVAMFSAAMSSIDTGVNRNAAVFVRDIIPAILRKLGRRIPDDVTMLKVGQIFTIIFGITVIGLALYLGRGKSGIFDIMMNITASLGLPMTMPLILGVFIKKVPPWSGYSSMLFAFVPSLISFLIGWDATSSYFQNTLGLHPWPYEMQLLWIALAGVIGYVVAMPFYDASSPEYKDRVEEFFTKMRTPVDFEKEIGHASDASQARVIGWFTLAAGGFVCLLVLVPNPLSGRLLILVLGGTVILIGGILLIAGRRKHGAPTPEAAK